MYSATYQCGRLLVSWQCDHFERPMRIGRDGKGQKRTRQFLFFFRYEYTGEKAEFEKAKQMAIHLASYAQGFLEAMPKSSSLASAKALAKHASDAPSHVIRYDSRIRTQGVVGSRLACTTCNS